VDQAANVTDEEKDESLPLIGNDNNQNDTSSVAFFSVDHYRRMSQQCADLNPVLGVMVVASLITVWYMWLDHRRDVAVVGWDTCDESAPDEYSTALFKGFLRHVLWCTSDDVAEEEEFHCQDGEWVDTGLPTDACKKNAPVNANGRKHANFDGYGRPNACCSFLGSCRNYHSLSFSCPGTPKPPENSLPLP
jgi:hypothetical protein